MSGKGKSAELAVSRGVALLSQGRASEALIFFDSALASDPNNLDAIYNRGGALLSLNRFEESLRAYERVVTANPNLVEGWIGRGSALMRLHRISEGIASFERAVELNPGFQPASSYLGRALRVAGRHEEAAAVLSGSISVDSDHEDLSNLAGARLHCCDWTDYPRLVKALSERVLRGKGDINPFGFLNCSASAALQLKCAKAFAAANFPPTEESLWKGERYDHEKIRIAYLSADFHDHATAYLAAKLFESHDRKKFQVNAVSFGPDDQGAMRHRLVAAFDRFVDATGSSDYEVARLLKEWEIDIAVDLKGFTYGCRPGILAHRPAPIQVHYLGYPGTMGAPYMDYIIADRYVIPPEDRNYYSEKVVYLPHSYQVNDQSRPISRLQPSRAELGLPDDGFVFCCFNANKKIAPLIFDIWMRLLIQVHGSVLWLFHSNPTAVRNLRREAARRGVDPSRLIFAAHVPHQDHLARYCAADLVLDTLPFNAHTTASDALWAGVPVVTCVGDTFAGKVAESLLTAIGMPTLITRSLQAYEALAVTIASSPKTLSEIRAKIAHNRRTEPLFDTAKFCAHIEAAYTEMWKRHLRDEAPEHFQVSDLSL